MRKLIHWLFVRHTYVSVGVTTYSPSGYTYRLGGGKAEVVEIGRLMRLRLSQCRCGADKLEREYKWRPEEVTA